MSAAAAGKGKAKDSIGLVATLLGIIIVLTAFAGWVNATGSKADEALKKATAIEQKQGGQVTKEDFNRLGDRFDKLENAVIKHLENDADWRHK